MGIHRTLFNRVHTSLSLCTLFVVLVPNPARASFRFGEPCSPSMAAKPVSRSLVEAATKPRTDRKLNSNASGIRSSNHGGSGRRRSRRLRRRRASSRGIKANAPLMWPIDPQCHSEAGEGEFTLSLYANTPTRVGVIPPGKVGFSMEVSVGHKRQVSLGLEYNDTVIPLANGVTDVDGVLVEYSGVSSRKTLRIVGTAIHSLTPVAWSTRRTRAYVAYSWGTGVGQRCVDTVDCSPGLQCKSDRRCHQAAWCQQTYEAADCRAEQRLMGAGHWACQENTCDWQSFDTVRPPATEVVEDGFRCGLAIAAVFDRSRLSGEQFEADRRQPFLDAAQDAMIRLLELRAVATNASWETAVISFADTGEAGAAVAKVHLPRVTDRASSDDVISAINALSSEREGRSTPDAPAKSAIAALELAVQEVGPDLPGLIILVTPGLSCADGECTPLVQAATRLKDENPHVHIAVLAPQDFSGTSAAALRQVSSTSMLRELLFSENQSLSSILPCSLQLSRLTVPVEAALSLDERSPLTVGDVSVVTATNIERHPNFSVSVELPPSESYGAPAILSLGNVSCDLPDSSTGCMLTIPAGQDWRRNSTWTKSLKAAHRSRSTSGAAEVTFQLHPQGDMATVLSERTMSLVVQGADDEENNRCTTLWAPHNPDEVELHPMWSIGRERSWDNRGYCDAFAVPSRRKEFSVIPSWVDRVPIRGGDVIREVAPWCAGCPDRVDFEADFYQIYIRFSTRSTVPNLPGRIRLEVVEDNTGHVAPWLSEVQTSTLLWHQTAEDGTVPVEEFHYAVYRVLRPGAYMSLLDRTKRDFSGGRDHTLVITALAPGMEKVIRIPIQGPQVTIWD